MPDEGFIVVPSDTGHWSEHKDWEPWALDRDRCVLWVGPSVTGGVRYEIELGMCASNEGALRWIAHIAAKPWGETRAEHGRIVSGLVEALTDILPLPWPDSEAYPQEVQRIVAHFEES